MADAFAPGKTGAELALERLFTVTKEQQTLTVHAALDPLALVPFAVRPLLDAEAIWQTFLDLARVLHAVAGDDDGVLSIQRFLRFEILRQDSQERLPVGD